MNGLLSTVRVIRVALLLLTLACTAVDFFNQINLLYGSIAEFCTQESCPVMNAGARYVYLWSADKSQRPQKLSAPDYMENLMNWVQESLDDESVFPSLTGTFFILLFFDACGMLVVLTFLLALFQTWISRRTLPRSFATFLRGSSASMPTFTTRTCR